MILLLLGDCYLHLLLAAVMLVLGTCTLFDVIPPSSPLLMSRVVLLWVERDV